MDRRARGLGLFLGMNIKDRKGANLLSGDSFGVPYWASARLCNRSICDTNASPLRLETSGTQKTRKSDLSVVGDKLICAISARLLRLGLSAAGAERIKNLLWGLNVRAGCGEA